MSGYSAAKASGSIRLMWIMSLSEASVGEEIAGYLTGSSFAELSSSVASKYSTRWDFILCLYEHIIRETDAKMFRIFASVSHYYILSINRLNRNYDQFSSWESYTSMITSCPSSAISVTVSLVTVSSRLCSETGSSEGSVSASSIATVLRE